MAITISGYQTQEQIYESANSVVYRGIQRADDRPVMLKILKQPYPSPEKIAWFKREYDIIRGLNLTGVIDTYALENDQHRWMMVLEDFGGESLARLRLMDQISLEDFLKLAIQIADTLGQIHQAHIIHKDINPTNLIFNTASHQVKLIDFGISTVLSRETPTFQSLHGLEGTLAYISPEQTGRMNRAMDYRTDFYSLGVTFYELLTGQLPFVSADPLELVHAHIARQPTPVHAVKSTVPQTVSDIVTKLMAKNAEDRYQSAFSLKSDLEMSLQLWQTAGQIQDFPLARNDVSDQLQLPQKLYAREQEINQLLAAFDKVSEGQSQMVLVAGYAGIGKTALIQEVYKPLTRQRGYFISGKFDQLQRNIPYASLTQAFRSLIRQLLTESEEQIAAWRQRLLDALDPNAQVLIEVMPEIELIIGPQLAIAPLGATEAQNRFNLAFLNFVQVFTQPEQPLVIFMDDLQWADAASLKLIQSLMTAVDSQYLFLIGAYRDNEVNATHPLTLTLEELQQAEVDFQQISLAPLGLGHIVEMISDTFYCGAEQAEPLAELLLSKTDGNPFFLNEFLKSLYVEGLVAFDPQHFSWQWDLAQIQTRDITDNVVELMAGKIQELGQDTQRVLKLAACIGNRFDLETLAIVSEQSPQAVALNLHDGLLKGLVLPLGESYQVAELDVEGLANELAVDYEFVHDRVQQATYSLIADEDKQRVHLQVGRLLLGSITVEEQNDYIFDIVNHLNTGVGLIDDPLEKQIVANLNLTAGQKAKSSTAYESALSYLTAGLDLLTEESWQTDYKLAFALTIERAECEYLVGNFEQAEAQFDQLVDHAASDFDKIRAYILKVLQYTNLGKLNESLAVGSEGLKLLGVDLSLEPTQEEIGLEIQNAFINLGEQNIMDLLDLPEIADPIEQLRLGMLAVLIPAAYFLSPQALFALIIMKIVNASMQHGNVAVSSFGYSTYGVILCTVLGNFEAGYEFGKLGVEVAKKFNDGMMKCRNQVALGVLVNHWKKPAQEGVPILRQAFKDGLDAGDLTYAGYAGQSQIIIDMFRGEALDVVTPEVDRFVGFLRQTKDPDGLNYLLTVQQVIKCLQGDTESPTVLSDDDFNEAEHVERMQASVLPAVLHRYYIMKMQLLYWFGAYAEVLQTAQASEPLLATSLGTPYIPEHFFFSALAVAALYPDATDEERERFDQLINASLEQFSTWATACAANYEDKHQLLLAEKARISGDTLAAMSHYDQAIAAANENRFLHNEALANELAAKFHLAQGREKIAQAYLQDARYGYRRWGATAKVEDLGKRYPNFFVQTALGSGTATFGADNDRDHSHHHHRCPGIRRIRFNQRFESRRGHFGRNSA